MAARLEVADVTCAANVTASAPTEIALGFPGGILKRITIVIPDGHAGLTGIALGYAHTPVMPRTAGRFISGNDETIHYDIADDVPGVAWAAFVCNLDLQPHTWEVRFELDEIGDNLTPPAPAILPVTDLQAATEQLLSGA